MNTSILNNYNTNSIAYGTTSGLVLTDGKATRFNRELVEKQSKMTCSFGTPLTREELCQHLDKEVQSNKQKKLTLEEMLKSSYAGAASSKFSFIGEDKTYSFNEFINELKGRSEAMNIE